ncbi:hypothetical protein DH2020_042134 [Rehmannia glutinosa]|uniref:Maternal effect embryo arrest protein n=1 Tax=Rehmannia glutinosa TaxID=99300 RepID=A0ABR0UNV7_REHGL
MAEDVEVMQDNTCCAALKKKHSKLLEKYSKVEELKNKFRNCTALVQEKYDVIEKENAILKKALEELKVQANVWKEEKEKECGRCVDLEDEVSALKDEIRLLKQTDNSASQEADKQIRERLDVAEKEIKQLKELLDKERKRAALEKKNAELEKKKADEALKKVEMGKKKVSEAQKVANVERKKAEEHRVLWEKLKMETDSVKSMLAVERSKAEIAEKKVDAEKQKAIRESKRADLAEAKSEEQRKLAEMNLKKAMFEKDRADDLNRKFEEARTRAEKFEELRKHVSSDKFVKAQADESNTGKNAELTSGVCMGMLKNDAQLSKWMEKMLVEKEHNISREKKRADSEKKKAKEQKKVAEAHKKLAMEQKHRADQLSSELESYKLRLEELQKELREYVSYRIYADNAPLRNNDVISEADTVKLLKKRLKLEKMLVKHANKTAKVEALRNNMLNLELFHLKKECLWFQQRLDLLDKGFLNGVEGKHQLKKIGNQTSTRETLCSDGYQRQLVSGIDSGLDPPYRGSNQKMLQRSAINSSSASFSDRTLVGSQERGTFSVTTSDKQGEDVSNLKPTISRLSDKRRMRSNEHAVVKADNSMRSPIKDNHNERRVGYCGRKRSLDAVESIENSYSKGEQLHQHTSEKPSLLHGILNDQKDERREILKENSSRKLVRPFKKGKTCHEGMIGIHCVQDSGEPKSILDSYIDNSNEITTFDYMKLLDLDDAADENSYRRAIAMPLSPMLPEVEIHVDDILEADNLEMLACKSSQEHSSNIRDNSKSISSSHIIEMKKIPTNLVLNGLVSSQFQTKEDSADFLKSTDSVLAGDIISDHIHVSDRRLGMSDLSGSGNEETNKLCERRIASTHGGRLKYFVVSSDHKDNSSILRILQTMGSCMPQCSFLCSTKIFLQSILHTLSKAEDLSMKEKVCVLFSLILHGISEDGITNLTGVLNDNLAQSFDSVTLHIRSALSDPVLRRIFMESCDLFELSAVIENFILQRKVLVCGDVSGDLEALHSFKVNLVLDGNAIMVSEVVASAQQLVAGGSLLASLCSAVDHIGFVCEMSCNIITMQKFDPTVMLAILHAFAHICGSKYFTLQQYSIAMTVIKSLVMFLEKQALSTNSISFYPSMDENPSKIWLCNTNCPFSEGAISMEDVALLLLENLQKHGRSESWPQDSLVPRGVCSHEERTEGVPPLKEAVLLSSTPDETLCDFIDILSLVEILALFMSWDWTCDHIIGQICEYLESHLMEGFSVAAIIALLGQLGRLGVAASGYEDAGVKKLRGRLSAFVCKTIFRKLNLSVQFAIITSLFGLTPIKFEEIVEGKVEIPAAMSQSIPASF